MVRLDKSYDHKVEPDRNKMLKLTENLIRHTHKLLYHDQDLHNSITHMLVIGKDS